MPEAPRFLVVGAGIGGLCAALDLAELGFAVTLTDRADSSGGLLNQLDRQFPTDNCGMCRLLPMLDRDACDQTCLRRGISHERIHFLPRTEVLDINGNPGNLQAVLKSQPMGVDPTLCTGCGLCISACPVEIPDSFNAGQGMLKAIHRLSPQMDSNRLAIDFSSCTRCGACLKACLTGAISLDGPEQTIDLQSLAGIIWAAGPGLYDPRGTEIYGAELPDVITATAFERLASSAGPTAGRLLRPSDGQPARKIAWLQCVGSRNLSLDAPRCSSACCMFSLKEALMARERGLETTVFYMDMRTFGRDHQRYRDAAEAAGVRLIRGRPGGVDLAADGRLQLHYETKAWEPKTEDFDLLVLSTGADQSARLPEFARREGVFVLDEESGFHDIAETVLRGLATSSRLLASLPALKMDMKDAGRSVVRRALVVGSGPAGLSAALVLADSGIEVDLAERNAEPGGNSRRIRDSQHNTFVEELKAKGLGHQNIHILLNTEVTDFLGLPGVFTARLCTRPPEGGETLIRQNYGAVILATGGQPAGTDAFGLGRHPAVITQFQLDQALSEGSCDVGSLKEVVFIQCAGTREEPRNYCSRICCLKTLRQALELKKLNPGLGITVLYRDMMAYGASEEVYTEARRAGILFIPYENTDKPLVNAWAEKPMVEGFAPVLAENFQRSADLVVLAVGLEPADNGDLAMIFGIRRTQDGFFQEADSKWRPVDSGREGVFVCGLGRAPCRLEEAVLDGQAAAMRALRILSRERLPAPRLTAMVKPRLCSMCEACIPVCPYLARFVDAELGAVQVDSAACQGCGACAAACPNGASFLAGHRGLLREVEDALEDMTL